MVSLDAGKQLRLPCPATVVVRHPRYDIADRHGAALHVRLVDHLHLDAAVALDPQEPDGNALNGSSRASVPVGNGSAP